jgi:diadenosine tetraphosphate (Ap4A) HIT family hydrolase
MLGIVPLLRQAAGRALAFVDDDPAGTGISMSDLATWRLGVSSRTFSAARSCNGPCDAAIMSDQPCAVCATLSGPGRLEPIYEDDLWHVRPAPSPPGVPGWMMMITRRHVGGPAHFNDDEARAFGLALRHFERVLEQVTGALRVYTAAMGESSPHFHAHMVPRTAAMPKDAKGWGVFDLERAAKAGEIAVDDAEVRKVTAAYARALAENPPPRP